MRTIATLTAAAVALACLPAGGCGLLFLPAISERPAEPLRTLTVVDAVTAEPVPDVEVALVRLPWADDRPPHPWATWGVAQSEASAVRRLAPKSDPADLPRSRPARPLGSGRYVIRPHGQWTWYQVLFPFGTPYGPVVYHTRQAHLLVSAPGYRTVWVSDPWVEPSEDQPLAIRYEFGPAEPAQPGPSVRLAEDGLRIALPPRSLPTRSPTWRRTGPKTPTEKPPTEKPPPGPDAKEHEGADG